MCLTQSDRKSWSFLYQSSWRNTTSNFSWFKKSQSEFKRSSYNQFHQHFTSSYFCTKVFYAALLYLQVSISSTFLCTNFSYNRCFSSFYFVHATIKSCRNDVRTKTLYIKMLMKLTPVRTKKAEHVCMLIKSTQGKKFCIIIETKFLSKRFYDEKLKEGIFVHAFRMQIYVYKIVYSKSYRIWPFWYQAFLTSLTDDVCLVDFILVNKSCALNCDHN